MILTAVIGFLVLALRADGPARAAEADPERPKAELAKLQGNWLFESYEEDGKPLSRRALKGRTIFFGADRALIKDLNELIQAATLKLDPNIPGAMDMTIVEGPYRNITMLGIYELKDNTLRVCFDKAGRERPKEYKTATDSGLFVAVYRREKPLEEVEIAGRYQCEGQEVDGNKYQAQVEIRRVGDAYTVLWSRAGLPMHIGIGVRKGNLLGVSFASKTGTGIVMYQIGKDRKLQGEWTDLGGIGVLRTEKLTPK
jgi:uncharacterized protein (TIGR03067 family)